jgi:hypothetical protein
MRNVEFELTDGYWTAEFASAPSIIHVYSYETSIYDKCLSVSYYGNGNRDSYVTLNDSVNSRYVSFAVEYGTVSVQYKTEYCYYEDRYEEGVLDTHGVSNREDPESINDVLFDVDGKIRYCILYTDGYYYYFPGQGWSSNWEFFVACDAPEGYEDRDETYFAENKISLICTEAKGDDIVHDMSDATCLSPTTCKNCGHTEGEALGHDMADATCTTPATCKNGCGLTEGEALGHDMADATCTTPKTCKTCGHTGGEALGHDWVDATHDAPKTCSLCGATEGEPLPEEGEEPNEDDNEEEETRRPNRPVNRVETEKDDSSSENKGLFGGCGSSIGIGTVAIVAIIGAVFVFKKKE